MDTVGACFLSLLFPPPIYGAYCSVTGSEASGGGPAEAVGFAVCGQAVATLWASSFPLGSSFHCISIWQGDNPARLVCIRLVL